jgi:di/tricarboxylate transporter
MGRSTAGRWPTADCGISVVRDGPLDGRAVADGGLRNLQGVFLAEIQRGEDVIAPVAPETALRGGDRLIFVGRADTVVDLQSTKGLVSSPLVGNTLKMVGFRGTYQAAVVAIHRAGQRVDAKLGSVRLRAGDSLLLLSDRGFRNRWRDRNVFLLVSQLGGTPPAVTRKAGLVGLVVVGIVATVAMGVMPAVHAALLAAMVLVLLGVLTPGEARASVDLDVILVIAGAFGLAAALEATGLAQRGAAALVGALGAFGPVGGLLGIALGTVALVSIITNNAAAVLMFPIALAAASQLGVSQRPFAVAVAIAASASFLTPIAYQTNMMVYGPGGYRFGDYARLGLPLVILVIAVAVLVIPRFWALG